MAGSVGEPVSGRTLSTDVMSAWLSSQGAHTIECVSSCRQSYCVECQCGWKVYGATETDVRVMHTIHRTAR